MAERRGRGEDAVYALRVRPGQGEGRDGVGRHVGGDRPGVHHYRKDLRPVITTGAEVMDKILAPKPKRRVVRRKALTMSVG